MKISWQSTFLNMPSPYKNRTSEVIEAAGQWFLALVARSCHWPRWDNPILPELPEPFALECLQVQGQTINERQKIPMIQIDYTTIAKHSSCAKSYFDCHAILKLIPTMSKYRFHTSSQRPFDCSASRLWHKTPPQELTDPQGALGLEPQSSVRFEQCCINLLKKKKH